MKWTVDGVGPFEHKTFVNKILHGKPGVRKIYAPRAARLALIYALMPEMLARQRLVQSMRSKASSDVRITCHGLFTAKKHEEAYETTLLQMQSKRKAVEHIKLACIDGNKWLVHPGTILTPAYTFATEVEGDVDDTPQGKRAKQTKPVIVEKMQCIPQCEQRDRLFAVASFQAEVVRATALKRTVDTGAAHARFDKVIAGKPPKQVFVLWRSTTSEGLVVEHADEVAFSTLYSKRL